MKHLKYLLILFVHTQSYASTLAPENIELSPSQAFCLGFSAHENTANSLTIKYPAEIKADWEPASVLITYLINNEAIFSSSTQFDKQSEKFPFVALIFHKQQNGMNSSLSFLYKNKTPQIGENNLRYYSIKSASKLKENAADSCGK
jgi:hypothetical protein